MLSIAQAEQTAELPFALFAFVCSLGLCLCACLCAAKGLRRLRCALRRMQIKREGVKREVECQHRESGSMKTGIVGERWSQCVAAPA